MTSLEFINIANEQIEQIKNTLVTKGIEYHRNDNPMHNFEAGAKMTSQSREEVLFGFLLKHLVSIQDIRNDLKNGILPTKAVLDEKYGDNINYLILEKAMILEKIENSPSIFIKSCSNAKI